MPLEGLLAGFVDAHQYSEVSQLGSRRQLRQTASIVVRTLMSHRAPVDRSTKVLYLKSNAQDHLEMIGHAVASSLGEEVRIIGAEAADREAFLDAIRSATLIDAVGSLGFALFRWKEIWQCVRAKDVPERPKRTAIAIFWRQLLLGLSMRRFLESQSSLECVIADFDRGDLTGPWFAAASSLSIPSCSFQHGVIFPSEVASGFSPLIGDAIGVWGSAAREQLIREGVDPHRIHLVGNPALSMYVLPKDLRQEMRDDPEGEVSGEVVLALSGWDEDKNRALVEMFATMMGRCAMGTVRFVVRLHPAHQRETFAWIHSDFGLEIAEKSGSLREFVRSTTALLVADSTFGMVGCANGIPTGRALVAEEQVNSGTGYFDYLGIPEIRNYEDFQTLCAVEQSMDPELVRAVLGDPVDGRISDLIASLRTKSGKLVSRTCDG